MFIVAYCNTCVVCNSILLHRLAPIILHRILRPWFYFDIIFYRSKIGKLQTLLLKKLHQFTKGVIKNREKNFNESELEQIFEQDEDTYDIYASGKKKKRLAMLDLLISAKNKGEFIDVQGIEEEVDTFMFEVYLTGIKR